MSLSTKENFRKLFIKRLKFFSKHSRVKKDKYICAEILKIIDLYKVKSILLYLPLELEVDIKPLINVLRKRRDIKIYVPFMKGDSFVMVPYRLPLKVKRFGIKEPSFSKPYKPKVELVVVPVVGIDVTMRRIGFGAGMYDRFFERLGYRPITIFTQLKLCRANKEITSSHDISPDYIVTA